MTNQVQDGHERHDSLLPVMGGVVALSIVIVIVSYMIGTFLF